MADIIGVTLPVMCRQWTNLILMFDFVTDERITQMSCDVAIVGGGISGLFVAETLVRLQKETDVCLFERDNRFGGRIRDHTFQRVPSIPVSKYGTFALLNRPYA